MMKKCFVIFGLLALLIPLVFGGAFQAPTASAQDGESSSKISSLLGLQVEAKRRAFQVAPLEKGRVDILQAMQAAGAEVTPLNKQQIFIHFAQEPSQSEIQELEAMGLTLQLDSWIPPLENHPTGFLIADMPVDALEALAAKDFVASLDTAEQFLEPQNDLAVQKINADDVWSANYTGANVTIAVLDSGLDVTHNDIPTPTDSKDYSYWPTLDDTISNNVTGHGTHVTGSALGRGTQSSGVYKGTAPGADLVFLKIGNDANSRASLGAMVNAIKAAVDNYTADIITMSYGGWGSYHDGTREDSQAVDYAVSQGAVVFASAGNYANNDQHYSGTVSANSTSGYISVNVTNAGTYNTALYYNLVWYDGTGTSNDLELEYYSDNYTLLSYIVQGTQSQSSRGTESEWSYYNQWLSSGNSTYYLRVKNNSTNSQFFHLYYSTGYNQAGYGWVHFDSPDPDYTIESPADADSAIAVGAYTTRTSWTDYKGSGQTYGQTLDAIASFSSRGPRVDTGAPPKPNIVAPGSAIISARDNDIYTWPSVYYDWRIIDNDGFNLDGSGLADYFVMQGTSMASPLAAGVAALILEKNPTWTPAQVKHALESTATDEGASGHDNLYGWGLIDAYDAVTGFTEHTIADNFTGAQSVYATDVDGDSDVDVLGAAEVADDITWWENDSSENFTEHTIAGSFDGARSVYATDVDADGDVDVLGAAAEADDVTWWENGGSENFTEHTIADNFTAAHSVYATDVDGDGDVDVLGAAGLADDITWWENDGSESFTEHTIDGSFDGAVSVYATDVDGDGDIDVFGTGYFANEICWWENDGSENFTSHIIASSLAGARDVYATDVDSDGDVDVLGAAELADDITWWENDGSENFTVHTIEGSFDGAVSVYATDVDGDGDVDVLGAAAEADDITWWENDGSENFTEHTINGDFDGAYEVYATDVDGDGDIDVLGAAYEADDITWWENKGLLLNSYQDSAHTTTWNNFSDYTTVYMYSTNLHLSYGYRMAYYDGNNDKRATVDATSGASGNLSTQHTFASGTDATGTWHVIVCDQAHVPPITYSSSWAYTIGEDSFTIQQFAAPPTMETIAEDEGEYYNTAPIFSNFGFDDDVALDDGWYQMDSYNGTWNVLFTDATGTSWDSDNWTITEFDGLAEGSHTIYFKASDDVGHVEGESGEWSWQFYKDTIVPSAVTDLAASNPTHSSMKLTWTAPGNDANIGTATTYDIRYSTSNITTANWSSATPCTGEPAPSAANTTETFTATGLSASTAYYFALKTADSAPNESTLSNVASGNTTAAPPSGGGGGGGGGGAAGVTPILNFITQKGRFVEDVTCKSEDKKVELFIPEDTIGLNRVGSLISSIRIKQMEEPPTPPEQTDVIGLVYDIDPFGATFDPPIDLTITYDESKIPEGVAEKNLVVAWWDKNTSQWVELESTVDPENDTITAKVSHFTAFTILAHTRPASFTVTDLSIIPKEVTSGESVSISILITNTGDLTGSHELSLEIDGVVIETKEVTLDGGDIKTISFSVTPDTAGEHTVNISDLLGTFDVEVPEAPPTPPPAPAAAPAPASFALSDLSVTPGEVKPAEQVKISAVVTNTGGSEGSYTVVLKINGAEEARKEVTLGAGKGETVTFTVVKDIEGSYSVNIDGTVGQFVVVVPPPPTPTPTEALPVQPPTNWWLIGGIISGCVVVIGLLVYFFVWPKRGALVAILSVTRRRRGS